MPRHTTLRARLMVGMAIAALAVVPLAAIELAQLARIERDVEVLTHRHMRQEAFGNRYLLATAMARRAARSFALLGDSLFAVRTKDQVSIASAFAESLRSAGHDSMAQQTAMLARLFSATFDTLVDMAPSYAANLTKLRHHAHTTLNAQRNELDRLLGEAALLESAARDSLLGMVQAGLGALDLDTLLMNMPADEAEVWRFDARLDHLGRDMAAAAESVVARARHSIKLDADDIATRVSRGERNLLAVLLVTIVIAAAWVAYFPQTLRVPLIRFSRMVRRAARGDFETRFGYPRYRELSELADALNQLLDFVRRSDQLRSEKVRTHWRRLQLIARESREFWCISDGTGRPALMSAPLSERVADPDRCVLPPAGFTVLQKHQIDPTDPSRGSVFWLKEIGRDGT